jgi:hypothetical protein
MFRRAAHDESMWNRQGRMRATGTRRRSRRAAQIGDERIVLATSGVRMLPALRALVGATRLRVGAGRYGIAARGSISARTARDRGRTPVIRTVP